jgi:hypothetical protein
MSTSFSLPSTCSFCGARAPDRYTVVDSKRYASCRQCAVGEAGAVVSDSRAVRTWSAFRSQVQRIVKREPGLTIAEICKMLEIDHRSGEKRVRRALRSQG